MPDHTTICRFRNILIEKDLLRPLLDDVKKQMEQQGKLVKKGAAVDASIVSSAPRPRKQVDIETVVRDREEGEPAPAESTTAAETKVSVSYSEHSRRQPLLLALTSVHNPDIYME